MRLYVALFAHAWLVALPCLAAPPRIMVELATEPGFPIDGQRRWIEALKDQDLASLRIRTARSSEEINVTDRGSDTAPLYAVVGVLTARNRLLLPGGEFSIRDRAGISKWFQRLREEGPVGPTKERLAFGLSGDELLRFHEQVSHPVTFSTKGERAGDVARRLVSELGMACQVTVKATEAFRRNEKVLDELQGLTTGTALAAVIRPLGLVAAPRKKGRNEIELLIAGAPEIEESWPVGWPPQDSPYKVAPDLHKTLTVEIEETPLADVLAAIQQRVDVPLIVDRESLARKNIDPKEVAVSFSAGTKRRSYQRILSAILFKARLTSELRVDESHTPFLWITVPTRSSKR